MTVSAFYFCNFVKFSSFYHIQVLFCGLTEEQKQLYRNYIESKEVASIMKGAVQVNTHIKLIA